MGPEVPEPLRGRGFRAGLVRVLLMEARWGRPGSRGRPCLTPLICAPHALSDQETLNKPMFEMCLSKYSLSKSFRMQASIVGPRVEPTAGKGPSPQTLLAPTGKRVHIPGALLGASPQGDGTRGTPVEKPGSRTLRSHGGGVPRPQEATLGEVDLLPPPFPLTVPQDHLPVDAATSQSVGLNLHPEVEHLLVFTSGDVCPLN